ARLLAADVAHAGHGTLLEDRGSLLEGGCAARPTAAKRHPSGRTTTSGYRTGERTRQPAGHRAAGGGPVRRARGGLCGGRRAGAASCTVRAPGATRLQAVRETLDAVAVRRWCAAGLTALRRHEHEINQLNVYPVPDGDTGTNLVLTLTAAQRALAAQPDGDPAGTVLQAMARGALLGARGNSGVIVAQLLRGLADALAGVAVVGGREFADALTSAAKVSYAAVAQPVEGTILSVATAAARAAVGAGTRPGPEAAQSGPGAGLGAVVQAAADAGGAALAGAAGRRPAGAGAGGVGAGGRGLVVLLDALVEGVAGTLPERPPGPPPQALPPPPTGPLPGACTPSGYAYEVQYLLDADEAAVARLRSAMGRLGDSLVVVGTGDGTWNVHVHVDDVGAAIEAGVSAGRP